MVGDDPLLGLPVAPVVVEQQGTLDAVGASWQQLPLAAIGVLGSYFGATYLCVIRPARRGEAPAVRSDQPVVEAG